MKKRGTRVNRQLPPQEQITAAYQQTFRTEAGEVVLADLEKRFQRRSSFAADAYMTAFREGQRDVYLMILNFIEQEEQPRG
jgi:hypothetical protein